MLASSSVQEVMDLALIAQAATLKSRIPCLHFFDGFRTSHEVAKIEILEDDVIRAMIDEDSVLAHRQRGLNPDRPSIRGTSQNPDVFFQCREAGNSYYKACPGIVQEMMNRFAERVGRQYKLFDYCGSPDAKRVIVILGSGGDTALETVRHLNRAGEKVGLVKVRLYRPFDTQAFVRALPASVREIAVLDRTKEPGSTGEPLYQDVLATLAEEWQTIHPESGKTPHIIGGRYGLSSKEFTPAMVQAVFTELAKGEPKNHFTVGIRDDVSLTSLGYDEEFNLEPGDSMRAMFYGLGADGTVGANKNSIKIIGEETENHAQGYFVYDSKKSGSVTISHLRFGPEPIRSSYLIDSASFIGCHQFNFLDKYDVLEKAATGATSLLNSPHPIEEVWQHLPAEVQQQVVDKKLKFYVIDAYKVAKEADLGVRINTIMQTCFFFISGILPPDKAIAAIKGSIQKTYAKKGQQVVEMNYRAVDHAIENLFEVQVPDKTGDRVRPPAVSEHAPDFVQRVTAIMIAGNGNRLPVSAFPPDGTWPSGTSQWEKMNTAQNIPIWDPDVCIQCNKCAMVCPHAAIRVKVFDPAKLDEAPETFQSIDYKGPEYSGSKYTVQVATESFSESLSYFPDSGELDHGVDEYLNLVRKAHESLSIPAIASLNGAQTGGWTESAKLIEEAGADALELNIHFIATSLDDAGDKIEKRYVDILKSVKSTIRIPVTVKLSPYFSSLGHMARQLVETGAEGLVLFNRSYMPDIQIEELEHQPHLTLSDSDDLKLPLHWLSILHGRIPCDLAATSGIHSVEDVVKAVMAGASVTHLCSGLLKNGPGLLEKLKSGLADWLEEHEYNSLGQMLGSMSLINCPNPSALERANYMKTLYSWKPQSTAEPSEKKFT